MNEIYIEIKCRIQHNTLRVIRVSDCVLTQHVLYSKYIFHGRWLEYGFEMPRWKFIRLVTPEEVEEMLNEYIH